MEPTFLTGHFIIAMPSLNNSYFDQSVTYICEHDTNGAFGLVINHETNITFDDIISELDFTPGQPTKQQTIYVGGPVQQDRGFILHKNDHNQWASSMRVTNDISLTTSADILKAIANDVGPKSKIIALGYAGWGPGQLEREFLQNAWLNCVADDRIIFKTPIDQRFQAAADIIGVDMSTISNDSGHA